MHAIRRPLDIRSFQTGLVEGGMKRNHASHLEVGTNFADGRDVWLELFVTLRGAGGQITVGSQRTIVTSRACLPEVFKNLRIHLAKFLNRCATPQHGQAHAKRR